MKFLLGLIVVLLASCQGGSSSTHSSSSQSKHRVHKSSVQRPYWGLWRGYGSTYSSRNRGYITSRPHYNRGISANRSHYRGNSMSRSRSHTSRSHH